MQSLKLRNRNKFKYHLDNGRHRDGNRFKNQIPEKEVDDQKQYREEL